MIPFTCSCDLSPITMLSFTTLISFSCPGFLRQPDSFLRANSANYSSQMASGTSRHFSSTLAEKLPTSESGDNVLENFWMRILIQAVIHHVIHPVLVTEFLKFTNDPLPCEISLLIPTEDLRPNYLLQRELELSQCRDEFHPIVECIKPGL